VLNPSITREAYQRGYRRNARIDPTRGGSPRSVEREIEESDERQPSVFESIVLGANRPDRADR